MTIRKDNDEVADVLKGLPQNIQRQFGFVPFASGKSFYDHGNKERKDYLEICKKLGTFRSSEMLAHCDAKSHTLTKWLNRKVEEGKLTAIKQGNRNIYTFVEK